jgi:hypothetical protein
VGAAAAPAQAESVAIVQMDIEGVPPEGRDRLGETLEEGLASADFTVVRGEAVKEKLIKHNVVAGCSFGPCLRAVGQALGVELVLVARVVAEGPSFSIVLTLVETENGTPVAQVSDSCAVCTFDEAISAATLAVIDLAARYRNHMEDLAAAARPVAPASAGKGRVRKVAWWMSGIALVAGGAAGYLLTQRDDLDEVGWGAAGAAGAFAVTGVTLFVVAD